MICCTISELEVKKNQITSLISTLGYKPDLIVGDFNADNDIESAEKSLNSYAFYKDLTPKDQSAFVGYFTSHVGALKDNGYTVAYDNSIGPTTPFGSTVDWMYYQKTKLKPIGSPQVIDTIAQNYTDHNGVLQTFEII
jgi:hypothetical protein